MTRTVIAMLGFAAGLACGGPSDSKESSDDTSGALDTQGTLVDTSQVEDAAKQAVVKMTEAAEAFLDSLDAETRASAALPTNQSSRQV